eukprot:scaffold47207_cov62-Cyclotella_meneghiniana.AAC.2
MTSTLSPPPKTLRIPTNQTDWKWHSVDRSKELLSCARTALKISQSKLRQRDPHQQQSPDTPDWLLDIDPASLKLYSSPSKSVDTFGAQINHDDDTPSQILLKDSTDLLAILDGQLSELHSLVRRRGHTNDPTVEIQSALEKFQEGVKEMKEVCASLAQEGNQPIQTARGNRVSLQRRKHYELLSGHLESLTKERMDALKKELEMRSVVIRDQMSHRKKLLSAGTPGNVSASKRVNVPLQKNLSATSSTAQFQSPLFTMTAAGSGSSKSTDGYSGANMISSAPSSSNGNGVGKSVYAGYGGYGGSTSYGGYGASSSNEPSFSTGMRQRKQQAPQSSHMTIDQGDEDDKYTKDNTLQQIEMRRQNRQTASRLQSARMAEKSLAELTTMFSKMSNLITQQGEVLERIEDDVEAAGGDIDAGHDELVKVYGYTKGNRALILKVFAVLIFLICFMRFYKR